MNMRRSICYTEPKVILAGQTGNWKFTYAAANSLPKGTKLLFDLLSRGKEIEWQIPQTNLKTKENLIWLELSDKSKIAAQPIENLVHLTFQYEFILPSEVKTGENLTICMGSPIEDNAEKAGNRSQCYSKRRRAFHLYVDPKGKGDYKDPEVFGVDVKGNELHVIRIITPSLITKNARFDILVRFEDAFGNLTGIAPEDTLIELSYAQLRENLNWKLFVPETGFISLPNLYFNEIGLYHLQLCNQKNKKIFYSSPIICTQEESRSIFWGLLHGESDRFDAVEQIESCLRYFRDDYAMQFYGVSPFEVEESPSNDHWKSMGNYVHEFNEDDRFSAFLGFQWEGDSAEEGIKHILYHKDSKLLLRKKDTKNNHIKKVYKSHTSKELQGIPCFTMAKGAHFDFSHFEHEHEHVVEIYNAWGSSECLEKEGNPKPIKITSKGEKKGFSETADGSIRNALNRNCRFGFVAGGLDDRGVYSGLYESNQVQYTPGLTAIIAANHTRDALFQALQQRSCFATTGERIIVDFKIAEKPMGSEISTKSKPGLAYNRYITGYVAGTKQLKEILIIRNGLPFKIFHPKESYFAFTLDDNEPLSSIALTSPDNDRPPFIYYYLRAIQEDEHIAWGSPIWVDHSAYVHTPSIKKSKKVKNAKQDGN